MLSAELPDRPTTGIAMNRVGDRRLAGAPRPSVVLLDPPAAHVMAGGHDAGPDALGAPRDDHEVADARRDAHEPRLLDAETLGQPLELSASHGHRLTTHERALDQRGDRVFSENMAKEQFVILAEEIGKEIENGADGIVVGHGTDVMGHTAAVLSFMVQDTPVPIVMVGSQRSSSSKPSGSSSRVPPPSGSPSVGACATMNSLAPLQTAEPEGASIEEQGLGWKSSFGSGKGGDTISSGIEGAWKPNPTQWDMGYLKVLFKYEWELVKSPAGANQWLAKDVDEEDMVVDAHDPSKKHRPMMTTADLSLKFDPIYEQIARRFLENPEEFEAAVEMLGAMGAMEELRALRERSGMSDALINASGDSCPFPVREDTRDQVEDLPGHLVRRLELHAIGSLE